MNNEGRKNMNVTGNVQRHSYNITINGPEKLHFDHKEIKKILVENFPTVKYFCMGDEIAKTGTLHTHIYVVFSSRVRWNTVKKNFPGAHIEIARGSAQDNRDYCKKSGRWENSDKHETVVEGTFEEWGTFPKQKGRLADMEELYLLIEQGYSNAEILALNNDYILNIEKLDKLRTMLLIEKFKGTRRLDLHCCYVFGETGGGKTRGILDMHGDSNVYRVSDYLHPFDSYSCQPVIAFEEFRSGLRLSDMLNFCDIYPIELPARYTNKYACYNKVYIVSNWPLEDQYQDIQKTDQASWRAFLRRIHQVIEYKKDGSKVTYNSVEEYMRRFERTAESETPFDNQEND